MSQSPNISVKGKFGRELKRLWEAIEAMQPQSSPGNILTKTTRGTNLRGQRKAGGGTTNSSAPVWL